MLVRLAFTDGASNGPAAKRTRVQSISLVYSSLAFFFGLTGVSGLIFVVVNTPSRFLLTLVKRLAHFVPFESRGKVTRSTGFRYRTSVLRAENPDALIFCSSFKGACLLFLARQPTSPLPKLEKTSLATFPLFW